MILAIETATAAGEVALLQGGRVLGERALESGSQRHAAALLLAIDTLLLEAGRPLAEVGDIALSVGPGSFTSLRVGLATALGLCFGTGRCIVPVPTLAALAALAPQDDPVVPILDARKGQIYAAVYGPGGEVLTPECVASPGAFLASLRAGAYCLVGPGVETCRSEIERLLGARAHVVLARPSAASVGRVASRLAPSAPGDIELRYVRAPDVRLP